MKNLKKKINKLLAKMTLEEKISCCHAASKFATAAIQRLGIPALNMSDGPHGVREEIAVDSWDAAGRDDDYVTYLPTGTALAATWSRECARKFGKTLGEEARARGKDVILGPGVNMVRSPLCGRNFEYYSEDPYHCGEMAVEVIDAIQQCGTAACVKHFAANSQELRRNWVDSRCDERTLREIYFPAFEAAVKRGKAMSVMGAYNKLNGQYCCQNDWLLNQVLKLEWDFDGVVISDWNGVSDTFEAARNGMDLEMGTSKLDYNQYYLAAPFRDAIKNGEIDQAVLDDKVRRYLRLMFKLGMLGDRPRPKGSMNTPKHQQAARKIAEEAIVLLKNDNALLPFNQKKLKKLLVLGDNATRKHHLGGHSSAVKALYEISPLEGLQQFLSGTDVQITHIKGYPSGNAGEAIPSKLMGIVDAGAGTRGWTCRIWDNHARQGDPAAVIPLERPEFNPETDLPEALRGKDFGALISGTLTPARNEKWVFHLDGVSQSSLLCGDARWIENCKSLDNVIGSAALELQADKEYELQLPILFHCDMPVFPVKLTADIGSVADKEEHGDVLAAAKSADAVIIFGGQNHTFDCEGSDRKDIELHDGQNELIKAVAAVNPNTAVVLVGGSPTALPWINDVKSVIQMWYAGMEGGAAITEILFGAVNPSGKLPFTFPVSYADTPEGHNHDYGPEVCNYQENIFIGYRWYDKHKLAPLFPFGHGLSYTSFRFDNIKAEKPGKDYIAACSIEVTNIGRVSGSEVVQLYIAAPENPEIMRPIGELKGFEKVALQPGKTRRIRFDLDARAFSYFHPVKRKWTLDSGEYTIKIGNSSRNLPVELKVSL